MKLSGTIFFVFPFYSHFLVALVIVGSRNNYFKKPLLFEIYRTMIIAIYE